MYSTHFLATGFDLRKVVKANIKQAFVMNLPFRIKIGEQLTLNMGDEYKTIVVFRNKVKIPTLEDWDKMFWVRRIGLSTGRGR